MNAWHTGCLGLAAAVAWGALASDASAAETTADTSAKPHLRAARADRARSERPAGAKPRPRAGVSTPAGALLSTPSVSPASPGAPLPPLLPALPQPVAAAAPSDATHAAPLTGAVPTSATDTAADASREPGAANGNGTPNGWERLLDDGNTRELFYSVIFPAARGVTIAQIQSEGVPAVTFAVRPTKITRGSGLIATGQF